jgi:hypothetical protein
VNKKEAIAVQVQLILIYRFILEDKMFRKFYGKCLDINTFENKELERLLMRDDGEDILKNSIMELEEIKTGLNYSKIDFEEIMAEHNPTMAYRTFGIKGLGEVGKLDLSWLSDVL